MQRIQRFVADQRYDLPHHESMMSYISQEFYAYNKAFLSPSSRIVANWKIENNGGLSVRVNNTASSLLFASSKTGKEGINFRDVGVTLLTLTLSDNSVNYVEVQLSSTTCAPDTVAIWDTTANAGAGEEFTQTVDTAYEEAPTLISNTIAFTGDINRLPLAIVTTSGGVITSIVDARKMLFQLETDWSFGSTRTDRTIGSLKNAYDALATSIKEMKGTNTWYEFPFASTKTLKEYQNLFIAGGGNISWSVSSANRLQWSSGFDIEIAGRPWVYTLNAGYVTLNEGEALYVNIPSGSPSGALSPIVKPLSDVPLSPTAVGFSSGIQVLFFRRNNKIISTTLDIPDLSAGETSTLGEDLPQTIRTRLGLTSDTTYEAYASTAIIDTADSYALAIGKLDAQILSMLNSHPDEEEIFVTNPVGQSVFVATSLLWHPSNNIEDLIVTVNGQKLRIDSTMTGAKDYYKNSSNELVFSYAVPYGASLVIYKDVANGGSIGSNASLTVKEEGTSVETETTTINFVGSGVTASQNSPGVVTVEVNTSAATSLKKLVKNMTGNPLPAKSALSWKDDGTVELADANISSKSLFAGINENEIADGEYGFVIKGGNISGALEGLGASAGQVVYLSESPGLLTLAPPIGEGNTIFKVGVAESPDGLAESNAVDLYLNPEFEIKSIKERITLTQENINDKQVILSRVPIYPTAVTLCPDGGIPQVYSVDYIVSGLVLSWDSLGLDDFLEEGEVIEIGYSAP